MSEETTANEATDIENREPSHVSLTGLLGGGLLMLTFCVGCGGDKTPAETPPKPRGDMAARWVNEMGAGTPHRGTILHDGTEIITVGDDDHGQFLLMVRYREEERFEVITEHGNKVE